MTNANRTPALVTLGVPVFQGETYLPETLRSLQEQDHGSLEIVISDNGSTDATEEICRDAAAQDERVRYLRSTVNRGGVWNFNNTIAHARGDFFKIAAADDVLRPSFVSACVSAIEHAGTGCVLAFPRTQLIDERSAVFEDLNDTDLDIDQATPHERIARFFRAQASHIVYGVMRTDVLRTTRGFRPVVGDDFVLMVEMACRGRFALVPEQLFLQRRHTLQFSAQGQGQVAWYAPDKAVRFAFPQTMLDVDLVRAITSSPLAPSEKARCLAATLRTWVYPRRRAIAGDVRQALGIPWPLVRR